MNEVLMFVLLAALGSSAIGSIICVKWFEKNLRRKSMFAGLLVLSLMIFIYLMYVLKPRSSND